MLELAVRWFVDLQEFQPREIRFMDPERKISFLPHKTWTYETREFNYTVTFNRFGRRDVEFPAGPLRVEPVVASPAQRPGLSHAGA